MYRYPRNQNGTVAKDGQVRWENVLGKIQPSESYSEVAFVFLEFAFGRLGVMTAQAS